MTFLRLPYLYSLRKSQWLSIQELERRQWKQFHSVVHHAYEKVPYYQALFKKAGILPDDIRTRRDLSLIPITTKETLQSVPRSDLLARQVQFEQCIERRTSGTSGNPLCIVLSQKEKETQDVIQARAMLEHGMKLTDRRVVFVAPWQIPQRPYWFQRLGIWRKAYFSVFDDIRMQFAALEQFAPDCLAGTPSILKLIALEKEQRKSRKLAPRTIFSSGDLLDQGTRQLIESVFHVKVVDMYGSLEFGYMAWECPDGPRGYHLNMESVLMEFLRDEQTQSDEQTGEIICTSLHSYAMPLIRYRLGDLCVPYMTPCPCGRGLPLMKLIAGRANDTVKLPGGRIVTPQALADTMVKFAGMIQQFKIIQGREGSISVQIIKGRGVQSDTVQGIDESLRQVLGSDVVLTIEMVHTIERDPSGKRRAIVSHMPSS